MAASLPGQKDSAQHQNAPVLNLHHDLQTTQAGYEPHLPHAPALIQKAFSFGRMANPANPGR